MKKIIITCILFILLDCIYLYFTNTMAVNMIKKIQHSPVKLNVLSLVILYIFDLFVFYYFIIIKNAKLYEAFLLGFCIYGVYEFTNKSIFDKWTYPFVIIDTLWGGLLFLLTTFLSRLFFKNNFF